MQWRLLEIDSSLAGAYTGALNMAVDEAILADVEAGISPPTFRIYGWSPPCISLGHSQNASRELDLERVRELGYDVVIRPTGGRAVLHIEELTYSLIAAHDSELWCGAQEPSYRAISQAIAQKFDVVHESPQAIVVKDGKAIYWASHFDIDYRAIKQAFV